MVTVHGTVRDELVEVLERELDTHWSSDRPAHERMVSAVNLLAFVEARLPLQGERWQWTEPVDVGVFIASALRMLCADSIVRANGERARAYSPAPRLVGRSEIEDRLRMFGVRRRRWRRGLDVPAPNVAFSSAGPPVEPTEVPFKIAEGCGVLAGWLGYAEETYEDLASPDAVSAADAIDAGIGCVIAGRGLLTFFHNAGWTDPFPLLATDLCTFYGCWLVLEGYRRVGRVAAGAPPVATGLWSSEVGEALRGWLDRYPDA